MHARPLPPTFTLSLRLSVSIGPRKRHQTHFRTAWGGVLTPRNGQKRPICGDQRVKIEFLAGFSHFCVKNRDRHSTRRFLVPAQFVFIPGGPGVHTRPADVWPPPLLFHVTKPSIHPSLFPAPTKNLVLTPHFLTFSGDFRTFF